MSRTPAGEARGGWNLRPKLRWFAAEFLVVVTGVLVALALNAMYQRGQDGKSEAVYLSLLSRDVRQTVAELEREIAFDTAMMRDGLTAYRAISSRDTLTDPAAASAALQRLTVRRTPLFHDGTYRDLISTGHLRLIRSRELRDRIVAFFEETERRFEILNQNNSYFVDEMYNGTMISGGLIIPRATIGSRSAVAAAEAALSESLRSGYIAEPDRLWSLPPDAREWAQVKGVLLQRIRVAMIGQNFANSILNEARELKSAIDAERARF